MKPYLLKRSISRKRWHQLSDRQKRRIKSEIKTNLQCKSYIKNTLGELNNINTQDMLGTSHTKHTFTNNVENTICDSTCSINVEDNNILLDSDVLSSDDTLSSVSTSSVEPSFREKLASCFVNNNFTHVQGNHILSLLKTHSCFHNLPKDVRTLVDTPRDKVITCKVEPGEYIHFDIAARISRELERFPTVSLPNELDIDFNTDGCSLDKSNSIHIWPIQCRLANIRHSKPIVVGIYKGAAK